MRLSRQIAAGWLVVVCGIAAAQPFPSRPVTMVVPFAAGGGGDTVARIVADGMRSHLGQPVIVENMAGANGSIGARRVARAQADGYTLVMGQWGTHVANGALYQLDYDVVRDFEPIGLVSRNPLLIVGRKDLPARDLRELVAWLKANPGRAMTGTSGPGGFEQIVGLLFQRSTGTSFEFVPYRGSGPAVQDLVAGRTDFIIGSMMPALTHVRAGSLKAFAVTSDARFGGAPEVPTVDEAGVSGMYFSLWSALWAPRGTPREAIARLNAAVVAALADPEVRKRFADPSQVAPRELQTPEGLRALQQAEIDKWWPVIRAAAIRLE